MKNRNIILTAILSLLVCGGLSCMAQNAPSGIPGPPTDNVNVVNTPNVNVANTPKVTVVNTTANPVPVTGTVGVAENPARQAVQQLILVDLPQGGVGTSSPMTIPAGEIFVIEFASWDSIGFETPLFVEIQVQRTPLITGGQSSMPYALVVPPNAIGASQAVRLYAQPGTNILVGTEFPSTTNQSIRVALSGYTVKAQ
jgi:hypothetical protein